jgi:hypothetical protein
MKILISTILSMLFAVSVHAQQEPIKLGILLDTSSPLSVGFVDTSLGDQMKKVALQSIFMGPLAGALHGGGTATRNAELTKRLRASVADDIGRPAVYERELTDAFAAYTSNLKLVFLPADLIVKGRPDFTQIDSDDIPYVVVMEESTGLATPAPQWGTVAAFSAVEVRVYNVAKKKRTLKETFFGFGASESDIDVAVDSADTLIGGYPQAVSALSGRMYWRLSGQNVLHDLAKDTAHASEFPSIEKVFKDNAKRFKVERPKIKNWKMPRTGNAYVFYSFPKKDKRAVMILTDVDLLIKELGQNFDSLDRYIAQRLARIADEGFGVESPAEVPVLQVGEEWRSYMVSHPQGGQAIYMHKKQGDVVFTHQIVVFGDDPLPMLTKYQADLQTYVDNSALLVGD